jgi:hypothetical protein
MTVTMTRDQQEYQRAALRTHQSRYDEVLRRVGSRAPDPVLGQDELTYRQEVCRMMKQTFLPRNHELFAVQMRQLRADALNAIEPQLFAAVEVEAFNPAHVLPGELMSREVIDPYGKTTMIKFVGPECFVKSMGRPGRRVVSFNTSNGPVDASGRFMR